MSALDAYEREDVDLGVDFLVDLYQASQAINLILERETYDELFAAGRNAMFSLILMKCFLFDASREL